MCDLGITRTSFRIEFKTLTFTRNVLLLNNHMILLTEKTQHLWVNMFIEIMQPSQHEENQVDRKTEVSNNHVNWKHDCFELNL